MSMRISLSALALLLLLVGCAGPSHSPTSPSIQSGLQIGDDIVPWNPIHIAGPNKGTNACPICTYEARPAVQIFTKDGPGVAILAARLEKLVDEQKKRDFKGFIILLDSAPDHLQQLADNLKIQNIGLCYPDPQTREHDLKAYKINPAAINTVVIYKNYKVTGNFVNLDPADFDQVEAAVKAMR